MKPICLAIIMMSCVSVFARNIELLNSDDQQTLDKLEVLQWCSKISEKDECFVTNALTSSKDSIAEAALCVAIVHDIRGLKDQIQQGVGPSNGYCRLLSNLVVDGFEKKQSPIESLMRSSLLKDVPNQLREKANHFIAVFVARKYRGGEVPKINLNGLEFSSLDQKILQYSKLSSKDVVADVIGKLRQAEVAGANEYDLVRVLNSYEGVAIDDILNPLQDKEGTTVYGKMLLLSAIDGQISKMTAAEKQRTLSALRCMKRDEKQVERMFRRVEKRLENN